MTGKSHGAIEGACGRSTGAQKKDGDLSVSQGKVHAKKALRPEFDPQNPWWKERTDSVVSEN